ncbi:hypothetical protein MTO96_014111 [Rhipicephalus appendiculatus]
MDVDVAADAIKFRILLWLVALCANIDQTALTAHGYDEGSVPSGYFNYTDIGPVQKLSYRITNITTLEATWEQPHTTENITGFTLECTEQQHQSTKKIKVFPESEIVQARLDLEDQVETFECSVWAFSADQNGTAVSFNIATLGLHPVANLSFFGECDGSLQATWSYTDKNEAGFNLTICRQSGEKCNTTLVKKNVRLYKFLRKELDVQYQLSVSAIGKISSVNIRSKDVTANATSFPQVPLLADVVVKGASPEALTATWQTNWTHEIHFSICSFNDTGQYCQNYSVSGTLHRVNFTGLLPQTTYDVKSKGQVTYGNRTCVGPQTEQTASTYSLNPPKDVALVERTATSLTYSWARNPRAPNCRVKVVDMYSGDVFEDDCTTIGDEHLIRYNVTDLTPGRGYNVSIQNCAEYCGVPAVIGDHTNVAAPSKVMNFSALVTGFVNVTFTWEKPVEPNGPIDGYLIRIMNEDNNVTTEILADGLGTDVTIVVVSEFAYFRSFITAYNVKKPGDEKLFGPETSTTFESLGNGPFPPYPTVRGVQETGAAVYWEKAEDPRYNITSYNISVETKGSFPTVDTKFNLSHLNPWTRYAVSVSSCAQETGCGEARSTSFRTDVAAPSKPLRLTARSVGFEWIYLEWERPDVPNGPIDGFNVSLTGRNVSFEAVTTALSYNVSQLSPGRLYSISVYAFNYGFYNEKRGPKARLTASTSNIAKGSTVLFLILAVATFAITTGAVATFCLWPEVISGIERKPPTEQDETELHTIKPWLRIRRKLCPSAGFGEDQDEHLVN